MEPTPTEDMVAPDDEDTIAADPDEAETPFEEDDSDGDEVGVSTDE